MNNSYVYTFSTATHALPLVAMSKVKVKGSSQRNVPDGKPELQLRFK